jgi:hypothetical protein
MTVFVTKAFARFAGKAGLETGKLLEAAQGVMEGRFDADLGGAVFKQRVAREGGGKSGGFRTILAFRIGAHCFFVHGFAKNEKANVSSKELKALKLLADTLLGMSADEIGTAIAAGELREVVDEDGDENEQEG